MGNSHSSNDTNMCASATGWVLISDDLTQHTCVPFNVKKGSKIHECLPSLIDEYDKKHVFSEYSIKLCNKQNIDYRKYIVARTDSDKIDNRKIIRIFNTVLNFDALKSYNMNIIPVLTRKRKRQLRRIIHLKRAFKRWFVVKNQLINDDYIYKKNKCITTNDKRVWGIGGNIQTDKLESIKHGFNELNGFELTYIRNENNAHSNIIKLYNDEYDKSTKIYYKYLDNDVQQLKCALHYGLLIVIGIPIFSNFDAIKTIETGKLLLPKDTDIYVDYHCVLIVGFNDNNNEFIVKYDWGEEWGDNDYCYIPYDYIIKHVNDIWMLYTRSDINSVLF